LVGWLSIQTVFFFLVSGPVVGLTFLWPLFKDLQKRQV
jgi:hypothetical protein